MLSSKPVVIPTGGGGGGAGNNRRSTTTTTTITKLTTTTTTTTMTKPLSAKREDDQRRCGRHGRDQPHQPDMVPPAVAALLAVTSIPPPKRTTMTDARLGRKRMGDRPGRQKTVMIVGVFDEKRAHEKMVSAALNRSPLDVLLGSAEGLAPDDADTADLESEGVRPSTSVGRVSFESVPSLDQDDLSTTSSLSPPPPSSSERRKPNGHRKEEPQAESCLQDHPLLSERHSLGNDDPYCHPQRNLNAGNHSNPHRVTLTPSPLRWREISLKSNLTASLRVLRSAAKSFSNFTTGPATQAEDFITRSILSISPQFTDERRPLPLDDVPTPALRRYLNPPPSSDSSRHQAQFFSPHHHLHKTTLSKQVGPCTASIQLQTYRVADQASCSSRKSSPTGVRPPSPSSRSKGPAAAAAALPPPTVNLRPREPRENGDFLRVIVLEMNMRREGKLSDTAPGRARFILPPRRSSSPPNSNHRLPLNKPLESTSAADDGRDVDNGGSSINTSPVMIPRRWIATSVE